MEITVKNEAHLCVRDLIINGSQDPDATAIESPGLKPFTYRELREQTAYTVRSLNALGLRPNDRIAVVMPNGPHTAVAILAVMAGFTVIPLNSQNRVPEYDSVFSQLGISAVLVQKGVPTEAVAVATTGKIRIIEVSCSRESAGFFTLDPEGDAGGNEPVYAGPTDIAAIKLTSGTTARPKAVPISQKRFFAGMQVLNASCGLNSSDRNLHFLSTDTGFGYEPPLGGTFLSGGVLIYIRDFLPSDILSLIRTYNPTYYWGSPAHHHAIMQELEKVPRDQLRDHSLRLLMSGSAAIDPAIIRKTETVLGLRIINVYVMSEAYISVNNPGKTGSVGIPFVSGLEIRDDEDRPLPPGQAGEVVVRGDLVFDGYLNAPEENAAAFIDGWFRTGDTGYLDHEGYLFLTGRKKEMINKGGRKIAPAEIDSVLISHPGVSDAMTFRIPDPVLGEDIASAVVKKEGVDVSEEDLRRFCLDRLNQFKVPRNILIVASVPKNPMGKPLREEGTNIFRNMAGPATGIPEKSGDQSSPQVSGIEHRLLTMWEGILDRTDFTPEDDFFRCGGNSLTAIELLIRIQREYHANLPPDTIYRHPTIRQQAVLIADATSEKPEYHPLIVPIREGGTLPPLFCIHALGGWIDHYAILAPCVDRNRPIFGLRARGLEPGETIPPTVEETARELVDAIKTVSRNGPYSIAGFSNGGTLAFECACQLTAQGDTVDFLGIIDQSAPATEIRYLKTLAARLFPGRILGKIPAFFESRLKANPDSGLYYLISKTVQTVFNKLLSRSGTKSLPPEASDAQFSANFNDGLLKSYPEASHAHMKTQLKASQTYLPRKYPGDLFLFSTGPDPILFPRDETRGWGSCTRGTVTVVMVPGNHSTLFDDPHLGILGTRFNESLKLVDGHGK